MALVTLEQVKDHLKVTHHFEDRDLELKLRQATAIILDYLNRTDLGSPLPDDPTDLDPTDMTTVERAIVSAAIIKLVANFDRWRGDEAQDENPATEMFLTPDIRGILSRLRDPAMA